MTIAIDPQTAVFNQVEELVGTYPSADGLRSAIHAVITKSMDYEIPRLAWTIASPTILANVEYLAKNYEARRGIHTHMGVMGQPLDCQYAMQYAYASGCDNSYIWNSNRSI